MSLDWPKIVILLLPKDAPLSEIWMFGLPYASYVSARLGITACTLVYNTSFATRNLDLRFCFTIICFVEDMGPIKSAIFSHHFFVTYVLWWVDLFFITEHIVSSQPIRPSNMLRSCCNRLIWTYAFHETYCRSKYIS